MRWSKNYKTWVIQLQVKARKLSLSPSIFATVHCQQIWRYDGTSTDQTGYSLPEVTAELQ